MQGILGTSLNRPLFYVNHDDDRKIIEIYYGMEKLTTVPNDKNSLLFRSAIVMLVNAGVRVRHIQENFNLAYETVKSTVKLFSESKNDKQLVKNFRKPGRSRSRVSNEVFDYIHERARHHKANGVFRYIKGTINDVRTNYGISLARETIRRELNKKHYAKKDGHEEQSEQSELIFKPRALTIGEEAQQDIVVRPKSMPLRFRNQYAGILLLSFFLTLVLGDFPAISAYHDRYNLKAILTWWIMAILLGAKNLEQQRYLNTDDFEYITGSGPLPAVPTMRRILHSLGLLTDTEISSILLRKNIDCFVEEGTNYYIDGHFEPYTGKGNILQGWSTVKNRVLPGTQDFFVHDEAGNPIFSLLTDCFYDFREILKGLLERIKSLRPGKSRTLIYDRGGFSTEVMQAIDVDGAYFVTWQKGFKKEEAAGMNLDDTVSIELEYNRPGHFKKYAIHFGEDIWKCKDFKCRRFVFRKPAARGEHFYQSVLTNDNHTDGGVIIQKILMRQKQDNDFKKQKEHFGLDEITSYKKLRYGELGDKDPAKLIKNKVYDKKLATMRKLKKEREQLFGKIGMKVFETFRKEEVPKTFYKQNQHIQERILKTNEAIHGIKKELKQIPRKVGRLDQCQQEDKIELDLRSKKFFGVVKITTRNIFNAGAGEFLKNYNNLRDYQKVFRQLVRSGGEIEISDNIMKVTIDAFGRSTFKEACAEYFRFMNEKKIMTIDGKYVLQFAFCE